MAIATFQLFLSASARQAAIALIKSASVRHGLSRITFSSQQSGGCHNKRARRLLAARTVLNFHKTSGLLRLRLGAAIGFPLLLAGLLVDRGLHPAAVATRSAVGVRRQRLAGCRLWFGGLLLFLGGYSAIGERRKHDGGGANGQGSVQR